MATTKKKTTAKKPRTKYRVIPESERMELDDIKNNEPVFVPKPPRQGRPKSTNYLEWEAAKEFVRGELIPSRNKYMEWWERHKPKSIPKYPYRVYKEWTSWNDFLGNDNNFGVTVRNWRPMNEAILWVHRLRIESYPKWLEYCKTHEIPEDIPTRPDLVYNDWRTWNHWLGNKPVEALEAIQIAQRIQVYYIIHIPGTPENVFVFGIEPEGITAFKERWQREQFNVVRLYWYEPDKATQIRQTIEKLSTSYLGDEKQRVCPNFWEINWYLQMLMEQITTIN